MTLPPRLWPALAAMLTGVRGAAKCKCSRCVRRICARSSLLCPGRWDPETQLALPVAPHLPHTHTQVPLSSGAGSATVVLGGAGDAPSLGPSGMTAREAAGLCLALLSALSLAGYLVLVQRTKDLLTCAEGCGRSCGGCC